MPRQREILIIVMSVIAAIFSPVPAFPCSLVYPTVQVGPNFRARITDRGRPVPGLRLELAESGPLTSDHPDVRHSMTDAEGFAHFTKLAPASLFLRVERDGGIADGMIVEVKPDGPLDVTVPLKWPSNSPLRVQSVRGTLRAPNFNPQQTRLSLSLLEGVSGRVVETTESDAKGRFTVADVAPGIYFLQLNSGLESSSGEQITGLITIDVGRDAGADGLDLDLGWSSCGLSYVDQTTCQQAKLEVSQVCGDVFDVSGAVISNAEVLLLADDAVARTLERTHSDEAGHFSLAEPDDGIYQLTITSAGFSPLRRKVHVHPTGGRAGCPGPIKVRMSAAGSCSSSSLSDSE